MDLKLNVLGFSKKKKVLKYRIGKYDEKVDTDTMGMYKMFNKKAIKQISKEKVYRDLGFDSMILKHDFYGTLGKSQLDVKKTIVSAKIEAQIQEVFKNTFIRLINRGYTQKNAKQAALKEAMKYRDEELSYWDKELLL